MRAREFITEKAPLTGQQVDQIKQDIVQKIQSIADPNELNKIYSYVRKLDIGTGFEDIFTKDNDLRQVQRVLSNAIIEAPGTFEEKMAFAKEMITGNGIISLEKLFTPGEKTNLTDLVLTKYPEIFNSVAPELLNIAGAFSAGGKKTNRGKGEFFLALSSPKISLSKEAGDLNINGKLVEVKGDLARLKGRKGYGTTDAAYSEVKKNIVAFLKKNVPDQTAPDFKVGIGAKASLWNGEFGKFCADNQVPVNLIDNFLKEELKTIVRALYLDLPNSDLNAMLACVKNGVLDFGEFVPVNKRAAFDYYQRADQFAGVLFINSDSLTCIWCPDAQTFQTSIRIKGLGYEIGQQNGMQIRV